MPGRQLIPLFWEHEPGSGPYRSLFNFRRIWLLAVGLICAATIVPLLTMAAIEYKLTSRAMESEARLRTSRIVSVARHSLAGFFSERMSALTLVMRDNSVAELSRQERLAEILGHLAASFGGFVDLGLIDASGRQVAYAGPYELSGADYSREPWFTRTLESNRHVSDVFMGFRNVPHLIIATASTGGGGERFILRATLDTARFNELAGAELLAQGDSFIINRAGLLQTPSRQHGGLLQPIGLPVPPPSAETEMIAPDQGHGDTIMGFAAIEGTPFTLVVVNSWRELLASWHAMRTELLWFLATSVIVILVVVVWVATWLVNRIYMADQNRVAAMQQMELANKMASIGRLAAGVAHEINNPLAVIGEKAGLIKDLLTFTSTHSKDDRLLGLVDSIAASVERCGAITKRLLGFARRLDLKIEEVSLGDVVDDVLSFLRKEADYKGIRIVLDVPADLPPIVSDRGKLQQILLNIVNNAFAAMDKEGRLEVAARPEAGGGLVLTIADNGSGISEEDQKHIFEPFFTTRRETGGTGLGLAITYGLVEKLGGSIQFASTVGKGTTFTIHLPQKITEESVRENTCVFY
jgi:signal transduction histidine kinase